MGGFSGQVPTCNAGKRELQVPESLKKLQSGIQELKSIVSTLEDRLSVVLSPAIPLPPAEGNKDGFVAGLAVPINDSYREITELCTRLESLIDRLEI